LAHPGSPAPKSLRSDVPCANILADRTQKNRKNVRILNGPGGGSFGAPIIDEKKFIYQKINVKKKRTEQFGAPRLFSSQSPIN
jgi:hypothetical protein